MKTGILIASAALICYSYTAIAQDNEPKLKINPTGCILLDGALYASPQKDAFKDGVAISDVRLGAKVQYGKWKAKIDVGFAYNKVGLKDIYFEYNFNEHNYLRAGSFIHQYGLQSATGSTMKTTMEEPVCDAVFNDSRQIGLMYVYNGNKFFGTASAHVEPKATTVILRPDQFTQEGWGIRSRIVARPIHEDGKVVQVGFSGGFATPQNVNDATTPHNSFRFKSDFPTRVTQVTAIDATVDHAMNLWKFTPEILLSYGPIALESQYYFQRVNRRNNLRHYTTQGAYATLRGLILGGNYSYSMADARLATPQKGALECVLNYNYTTLTNANAGIYGGRLNDLSCTFNYYINKYMIARLHYSYTHTWGRANAPSMTLNAFMARLQIIF